MDQNSQNIISIITQDLLRFRCYAKMGYSKRVGESSPVPLTVCQNTLLPLGPEWARTIVIVNTTFSGAKIYGGADIFKRELSFG